MERIPWKLPSGTYNMEVTLRKLHHGSYLVELKHGKLPNGTYTMEVT